MSSKKNQYYQKHSYEGIVHRIEKPLIFHDHMGSYQLHQCHQSKLIRYLNPQDQILFSKELICRIQKVQRKQQTLHRKYRDQYFKLPDYQKTILKYF